MPEEEGFVAEVLEDGWAKVITHRKEACGDCHAAHCCSSFGSSSKMVTRALNRAGASAGDKVAIHLKRQSLVKSATIVYMLPVVSFVAGGIAGVPMAKVLDITEGNSSVIFGLLGLGVGFLIAVIISKWLSAHGRLTPVITRVVEAGGPGQASFWAVDPVCGMEVDPSKPGATFLHGNRTYYFCGEICRESFAKDPEKYLN